MISICGKTILISLNSLNEHPIDENIVVEYTLMLMDLIPTFRIAELIMSRNPLTSDNHVELVSLSVPMSCDSVIELRNAKEAVRLRLRQ